MKRAFLMAAACAVSVMSFAQQPRLDYGVVKAETERIQSLVGNARRISSKFMFKIVRVELHRRSEASPLFFVDRSDEIDFSCKNGLFEDFESGFVVGRVERFEVGKERGAHFELSGYTPE